MRNTNPGEVVGKMFDLSPGDDVMGLYLSKHMDSPHVFRGTVESIIKKIDELVGYNVYITEITPQYVFETLSDTIKIIFPKYISKFNDVWYRRLKGIHNHPGPECAKINVGVYVLNIGKYSDIVFENLNQEVA